MSDKRAKITPENVRESARLKSLWDASNTRRTQAVFGEHYSLGNQANVGHYLHARSALNPKAAKAFAEELGCAVVEFSPRVAKDLADLGAAQTPDDEFQKVRHADVSFSNGHGQVVFHEDDRPPLTFRTDFLRKLGISTGNAVVVDAEGISNEPIIPNGAVVLVNRGDKERLDGGFFAYRCDGELLIKRLEFIDGVGILATAENSTFKPKQKVYKDLGPDMFEVIGRAVWVGAML